MNQPGFVSPFAVFPGEKKERGEDRRRKEK